MKLKFFITAALLVSLGVSGGAALGKPGIVINSPGYEITNISQITVTGETEPYAVLSLNKKPVLNNNGTFSEIVTLTEGLNHIIIEASKSGNVSKASLNITLDTISPEISIMLNQTYVNSTSLNLSYASNASDIKTYRVRLNNSQWHETSKSYYLLNLTEGQAFIEVHAVDYAGNIGEARVNITVDYTPPFIEIIKPAANETINTRFIEMTGRTETGANISVNGMNIKNDNGTWGIAIVLSGLNNPFSIESIDKAGNRAEKNINIRIGENLSAAKPFFEDFLNLSINFSTLGKFEGDNDAVSGKYVSYLFDRNASSFLGYSIYDSGSLTLWFNKITIEGFKAENSSIRGPVARYQQGEKFGEQHSVSVEIHDSRMGTMLIDIRRFEDIFGKVRDYLLNKPRERLRINVSRDMNVTLEKKTTGNLTPFYINETWKSWPEVTFEPADNVNVTLFNNGFRFAKDGKEAYLFRANYAGGSSDFSIEGNKLTAKVNNSLLIFRQFPGMNLTDEDILDRLISQGISDGIIGAEFFIDDVGSYDVVTFGDVKISASFPDVDALELNVSSSSVNGTVLAVGMGGRFFNNFLTKNLTIRFDGREIYSASSYQDVMDVTNDFGHAEYMLAMGSNGAMILVSIPGFSSHTISFKFETAPGTYGSGLIDLFNFLSAGLLLALPASSREFAFSVWWFAVVLTGYVVLKKIILKK